jgi:hypothetical protein
MPEPSPQPQLFIVRRIDHAGGEHNPPPFSDGRMVGAFRTREAAEAFLADSEQSARRQGDVEPLWYLMEGAEGLLELTEFDPPVFHDWLTEADIPPPRGYPGHKDWYDWLKGLSPQQAAHLCAGLHRLQYHEIIAVDLVEESSP